MGHLMSEAPGLNVELIRWPDEEDLILCKMCAYETMGKDSSSVPTDEWLHDICNARHSPIRELRFVFRFTCLPYYISTHLARHIHAQPYIQTQRNDRQDRFDRRKAPQDAPVRMIWSMNVEELMTIANKRLCEKADPVTRRIVAVMCAEAEMHAPYLKGLLVPMCQYHGGICHEMKPCGRCVKG